MEEERYPDALERTVEAMRLMRLFSDYDNIEFKALLMAVLFDLSQIHYSAKDYKQAERELESLFKILDNLNTLDPERFGEYHILAMELSTHILRSRRKTLDMLARQQALTYQLLSKVNSGVNAATDRLVDSMRKTARLLMATGDYRASLKFYAEAIKYSKRRSGKVTRKEIKMTIEMAEIMMRIRSMRPRASRLLNAVLPHAIALGTIELEEDILALLEVIQLNDEQEPRWKAFFHKLSHPKKG
jgi:tetratricopeptide (TPR) repeat protein